jgi:glycosyltransferase involved in cell wall biosynthesis
MQPKKIAVYSGTIPSTTFIERMIDGLASNGFKVALFGLQLKKGNYPKSVSVYSYSSQFSKLFILLKYSLLLSLFKAADKKKLDAIIAKKSTNAILHKVKYYPVLYHKPDVFHLQWAKSLEDWIWLQEFGVKIILSLRGTHITISPIANKTLASKYKQLFPKVDGFHAVSNSIIKEALQYGANSAKTKVIYSGLNPVKMPFEINMNENKPLQILSIGRSNWVKGYTYALEACSLLKKDNFNFQYTIIGANTDEELLFQRAQLELENQVVFEKSIPFEKIINKIHQADILLLSSVEEGIANVVLEAMALGTLVISTNCGGMDEVILDEQNGFLVPIRNPKAMADKIKSIASLSENEKHSIKTNARKTIENQHDFDCKIHEMSALYQTVLEN